MPYKTQYEKHLEEVKNEIAQEFGLIHRRTRENVRPDAKRFKFNQGKFMLKKTKNGNKF